MIRTLILTLLSLTVAVGPVLGQAEPGDIGIFFDLGGTMTTGYATYLVPFFLYLVAFDVPDGLLGYEGSLQSTMPVGTYFILSAVFEPVSTANNFGFSDNWIVGTGVCYWSSGPTVLATFNILPMVPPPPDTLFCIGPYTPSSFSPPAPGYVSCFGATDVRTFGLAEYGGGFYPDGCAVANATHPPYPIAAGQTTWGAVKARF